MPLLATDVLAETSVSLSTDGPAIGKGEHVPESLLQFVGSGHFEVDLLSLGPLQEVVPHLVAAQSVPVAHNYHQILGASESDVDSALVSQKTKNFFGIGPHCGNDYDVLLLTLKRVHRVDHHVLFEMRQVLRPLPQLVLGLPQNN